MRIGHLDERTSPRFFFRAQCDVPVMDMAGMVRSG